MVIPYNSFPLPTETNILVVRNRISRYKKSSVGAWYINRLSKTLFVPSSIPLKQVQEFIETLQIKHDGDAIDDDDGIENILGDINSCEEDAELSRNYINVYLKGGKIVQRNYCISCVKDMFLFNLRKMFNASENDISMEEIINDYEFLSPVDLIAATEDERNYKHGDQREIFPFFSFGQKFYSFINEDKISNMAKAWITATAVKAIRKSQYFTFCPCHPNILIPRPATHGNIRCISLGCGYFLCCDCDSWHTFG
ncbi:hypothetical protein M9Y10_011857 [Tritrichomonas musculus]|uniref:Uncharacterized protein n=1 Tax=Tritrichomonas musculus TaxID=1915356 RepID=A0ABR2IB20_9EUKA